MGCYNCFWYLAEPFAWCLYGNKKINPSENCYRKDGKNIGAYIEKVKSEHNFCNKHKIGYKTEGCPLCISEEIKARCLGQDAKEAKKNVKKKALP